MYTNRTQKITKEQYKEALSHLIDLKEGWDGYGAGPLSEKVVDTVSGFLANTAIVPGPDGSLQIEWHCAGYDIEISFDTKGEINGIGIDKAGFCLSANSENQFCNFTSNTSEINVAVDGNANFCGFDLFIGDTRK